MRAAAVSGTGAAATRPVFLSLIPATAVFLALPLLSACLFFSRPPAYAPSTYTGPDMASSASIARMASRMR